jgi:hypothetical protein
MSNRCLKHGALDQALFDRKKEQDVHWRTPKDDQLGGR